MRQSLVGQSLLQPVSTSLTRGSTKSYSEQLCVKRERDGNLFHRRHTAPRLWQLSCPGLPALAGASPVDMSTGSLRKNPQ